MQLVWLKYSQLKLMEEEVLFHVHNALTPVHRVVIPKVSGSNYTGA